MQFVSLTSGTGGVSDSVPCEWIPFPLPGQPVWPSVGEDVPRPAGTRCPKVGWYPKGVLLLSGEGKGAMGARICKGLEESGEEAVIGM